MKSILFVAALFSGFSSAEVDCSAMHSIAHSMMDARQAGVSLTSIKNNVKSIAGENQYFAILANSVANEAFKKKIEPTEKARRQAAIDFSAYVMRTCYKMGGK